MATLRTRLFVALLLAAVIPSGLLLLGGTLIFREGVVATGTAGPWGAVAESGTELLDRLDEEALDPETAAAAEAHRTDLSESVRLSRLFALVGERVLFLLPAVGVGLLLVAAAIALLAANRVSRTLSTPLRELVEWTRVLGQGGALPEPLPATDPDARLAGIREFQELRDALRTMAGELEEARKRELQQERARSWSEMARRVAHDLKNPLTPMSMAARRVADSDDPALAEAGQILREEIGRLDELARSFAQFGRPPDGPPSEVDPGELLEGLHRRLELNRIGEGADSETVRLLRSDEVASIRILGHPTALERALRNLVANALDAARASGTSEPVEIHLERWGDDGVRIRILDRGPGLPEGAESRIWEPDFTTKRRGTGLGLPMVRQVVLAHGGRVEALNRQGGGAEFRIDLPGTLDLELETS